MGILNVTPDSFSDGGRFAAVDAAIAHADELVEEGADILDVGRRVHPAGATEVPLEEEIRRIAPVVRQVAARHAVPISIDTYKAKTAERPSSSEPRSSTTSGASSASPTSPASRPPTGRPVIVMQQPPRGRSRPRHHRGHEGLLRPVPGDRPRAGIPDGDVILDPGVGFGKTLEQNLDAIARLPEIKALGYPVLMGTSRKSLIGLLNDGKLAPKDRIHGTIASNTAAILLGADIVRVHDVRAHQEAARIAEASGAAWHDRPHLRRPYRRLRPSRPVRRGTETRPALLHLARRGRGYRAAGLADDFTQTVSYVDLTEIAVAHATTRRFHILEALAEAIAGDILAKLPLVAWIRVKVEKPSAPIPAVIENVSVEIERSRR